MRIRPNLGRVAARWRVLTVAQRNAWICRARVVPSRACLGKSAPLTGCQFFIKINCSRAAIGLEMLVNPPELPQFESNPAGELSITNTGGSVALKLSVPTAPTARVTVYSAGVTFVRNFTTLGALPEPAGGVSDISDIYIAKYGEPPPGSQVCIRTRQQINGWEDLPKQISAIVPEA